jgi:hypothetical protein
MLNRNLIQEEIKRRLNSGNAWDHSVENLLSSRLLSKNMKIITYRIIILPTVLYGCETCPLTLSEEHRLRVFQKRVLRKLFGSKRNEVTGGWEKLHNELLHKFYYSPIIIRMIESRRMRWIERAVRIGEKTNAYRILVGKPEGKRPLGRPKLRWVDNVKMDLREIR